MLEHEAIGADEVTDLVLVNLKAPDYAGSRLRSRLAGDAGYPAGARRAGTAGAGDPREEGWQGGFVVTVTADHGMPGGSGRHFAHDFIAAIDGRFGAGTVQMLRDGANSQVHVDTSRLAGGGSHAR